SEDRAHVARSAREDALKLLDLQRRTRRDLTRRLRDKGHDAAEIETVLDRLAELKLIDDVEYARAFIAGRWGRRAAGWRKIEMDLRGRGVSADDIAAGRERFVAEQGGAEEAVAGEAASALRVVQQAERRYAALDPRTRRQRLTALLLRRGFSYDTIEQVLRGVIE
ncbi:MAG: regulatory protein RecX, partial [Candidatus Eisenbacteria bacterium]